MAREKIHERHRLAQVGANTYSRRFTPPSSVPFVAKLVSHGRYVAFQMAEVAMPRMLFAEILRLIAELRPPPDLQRRREQAGRHEFQREPTGEVRLGEDNIGPSTTRRADYTALLPIWPLTARFWLANARS